MAGFGIRPLKTTRVLHTASRLGPLSIGLSGVLLAAGGAQALALAWPFSGDMKGVALGWVQLVSLCVLAWVVDRSPTKRHAFVSAWVYALAWIAGSIWWLYISMHTYGGLPSTLAALAVFLLAGGLALLYASACWVYHAISQHSASRALRAFAFAAVWTLAELARGTLWTGFPWGAVGYAHTDGWMRHWAAWVGVYGLCGLSALLVMAVAAQQRETASRRLSHMVLAIVTVLALGYTWQASPSQNAVQPELFAQPLRVTLVQGNIPQDLKFGDGLQRALHDYRDALLQSTSDLTVLPETAIPLPLAQMPDHYWAALQAHFASQRKVALVGLPLMRRLENGQAQYTNSALALMAQATPASSAYYQYDKHHLVPFGEFVPPLFQWFVRLMQIPLGEFTRGDIAQPSLNLKGERIAPNICYEDLFGEELARRFADADTAPTLMVNMSNIAWFGDTVAIDQHLNISRMRSLELGRPMLRATNTGATAIINAQGVVTHRLPSAVQGALTAEVYGVHGPLTPYARWVAVWGLWPLVGLAVSVLLWVSAQTYAARARSSS